MAVPNGNGLLLRGTGAPLALWACWRSGTLPALFDPSDMMSFLADWCTYHLHMQAAVPKVGAFRTMPDGHER